MSARSLTSLVVRARALACVAATGALVAFASGCASSISAPPSVAAHDMGNAPRSPRAWDTSTDAPVACGLNRARDWAHARDLVRARYASDDQIEYSSAYGSEIPAYGNPPYYGEVYQPPVPVSYSSPSFVAATTGPATRMAIRVEGDGAAILATARTLDRSYVPLRVCYEDLVTREPTAEGSISIAFVIGKDGKVQKGATTSGTPGDADLGKCIVKTVSELTFGAASAEASVRATLDLKIPPPKDVARGAIEDSTVPGTGDAETAPAEHDVSVLMK
jgi:hypothetical protein